MKAEKMEQSLASGQNDQKNEKEKQLSELPQNKDMDLVECPVKETNPEDLMEKKIYSAEKMAAELVEHNRQQLDRIENGAGLSSADIADVRREISLLEKIKRIGSAINSAVNDLKVQYYELFPPEDQRVDLWSEKSESEKSPEYAEFKERLIHEREIGRSLIQEARKKRNELFEAEGIFQMSKEDFATYFLPEEAENKANLKQGNTENCYVVAAINALSCSPHFEMICRSSMKKLPDGSWEVRLPLLSQDGQAITITLEELSPQKNRDFLKNDRGETNLSGAFDRFLSDPRMKLKPGEGKEGLRVLEAAFTKIKFGSVNRLAAEKGASDEVLLLFGGNNFKRFSFDTTDNQFESKREGLVMLNAKDRAYLDDFLENFDPEIYIATAGTRHDVGKIRRSYLAKGTEQRLSFGHAYSITGADSEKKSVSLIDPNNPSKPIELSFDQFKESFSNLKAVRVDSANLLSNIKILPRKELIRNVI